MATAAEAGISLASLVLVTPQLTDTFWEHLEPLLLHAKEQWHDYLDLDDIRAGLERGIYQAWLAGDEDGYYLGLLTEIQEFPSIRLLRVLWLGGSHFIRARHLLAHVEDWGRRRGCDRCEIVGRRKWEHVLEPHGYEFKGAILHKELK